MTERLTQANEELAEANKRLGEHKDRLNSKGDARRNVMSKAALLTKRAMSMDLWNFYRVSFSLEYTA